MTFLNTLDTASEKVLGFLADKLDPVLAPFLNETQRADLGASLGNGIGEIYWQFTRHPIRAVLVTVLCCEVIRRTLVFAKARQLAKS